MNKGSSRSHAALILTLRQVDVASGKYSRTVFHCVDLAGAERPMKATGERLSGWEAMEAIYKGNPPPGAQGGERKAHAFNPCPPLPSSPLAY